MNIAPIIMRSITRRMVLGIVSIASSLFWVSSQQTLGDARLPQIAPGDLDVAVIGQLPVPQLALGGPFKSGAVQVIGFDAARGGMRPSTSRWKNAPTNPYHALVLAEADAELDSPTSLGSIGRRSGDVKKGIA